MVTVFVGKNARRPCEKLDEPMNVPDSENAVLTPKARTAVFLINIGSASTRRGDLVDLDEGDAPPLKRPSQTWMVFPTTTRSRGSHGLEGRQPTELATTG